MGHTFEMEPDPRAEEARDAANAWVARFAPLVMDDGVLEPAELERRLQVVGELRETANDVRGKLVAVAQPSDHELEQTLRRAISQLSSVEEDLRRRLGRQAPGNPVGIVDYDRLQERLDEREAKQEIGERTDLEVPAVLRRRVSSGNPGGAAAMGIFGLGWTAFTTFHAFLMIGGMFSSFGFGALALLLFYAIFWAVGFGMLGAAWGLLAREEMELDGRELVVTRSALGLTRTRRWTLAGDAVCREVRGEEVQSTGTVNRSGQVARYLHLSAAEGKDVLFGQYANPWERDKLCVEINAYLKAQPS